MKVHNANKFLQIKIRVKNRKENYQRKMIRRHTLSCCISSIQHLKTKSKFFSLTGPINNYTDYKKLTIIDCFRVFDFKLGEPTRQTHKKLIMKYLDNVYDLDFLTRNADFYTNNYCSTD
jgi:hypothetical protein